MRAVIGSSAGQLVSLAGASWVLRRHLQLSLRRLIEALLPFGGILGCATLGSVCGLAMVDAGLRPWIAAPSAMAISVASGGLVFRMVGGALSPADLRVLESSFPRISAPLVRAMRSAGLIRTENQPGASDVLQ